ncbi:hypothetical protein DFR50_13129 [Roseiarcus fermentans]|uniref:Uncharacterized protein n=1 Tax=Roseiarcus fermentans TaxID=1473586 RepID=A0A366EY23_9HYPH|nr:hypothetical protein [Roseiarcus fermentans]RBP06409.1 hypothetical protein DFR50_13129 [Roseiarcus fermentans]
MSSQPTGGDRPGPVERPPGAGRQPNAQDLLAEFEQALESAGFPLLSKSPGSASAAAAEPRHGADIAGERDGAAGSVADNRGPRQAPIGTPARRPLRRRLIVSSGLALAGAAVAGAGFALMPSAPTPKRPLAEAPTRQTSSVVPGAPGTDDRRSDPAPAGGSGAAVDAEAPGAATAPRDGLRPADGSNATAARPADTPAASQPAQASTAPQPPAPEPVRSGPVGPNPTPVDAKPAVAAGAPPASEAPKPHDKATPAGGVRADTPRSPAGKVEPATKPTPDKASAQKIADKPLKARAAETPYPPPRPASPQKAAALPVDQPAPDPAEAAPVAPPPPASLAAQSVGQLTNAFDYLRRLPGALIGRVAGQSGQGQ